MNYNKNNVNKVFTNWNSCIIWTKCLNGCFEQNPISRTFLTWTDYPNGYFRKDKI